MAKVRNYHVYGEPSLINRLKEEYEFIGRYVRVVSSNHLVVMALPPKKKKKDKDARDKSGDSRESKDTRGLRKRAY